MSETPPLTTLQRVSDGDPAESEGGRTPADDVRDGGLPGYVCAGVLVIAGLVEIVSGGPAVWGLSRQALADGHWGTLLTHPIAHGSPWHLLMNCSALIGLTIATRNLLGFDLAGWGRYLSVLGLGAVASAGAYLLLHPSDGLPMVGASGAICALWGLAVRCDPETRRTRELWSRAVGLGLRQFAITNLVLFAILFLLTRASGQSGGLAWEAHLGGFLFGLLAAPWLIRPQESSTFAEPAATS